MATNSQIAQTNWEHYVYARDNGHRDFLDKATRCEQFYYGEQWSPELIAKLRRQGKPALTFNMVFGNMMTIEGEQLVNQADIAFRPTATGRDDTAHALTKLWLHISKDQDLSWLEQEVFTDGAISSRGYFDVRIGFDDNMFGEIRISRLNPKNVMPDPDADSYEPEGWSEVTQTQWYTPDNIENMFGKEVADVLRGRRRSVYAEGGYDSMDFLMNTFSGAQRVGGEAQSLPRDDSIRKIIRVLDRQHKEWKVKEHFVDPTTGDMRVIPESWDFNKVSYVRENFNLVVIKREVENIRWTLSVEDMVLHDEESPYRNFTVVPYFPFFHHGRTIGLIENLISPQEYINKISSQELHIVNSTANSGWQVEQGQLTNMTVEELEERGAETGLVIERKTNSDPIEKIQPNQIPTGLDRLSFKATEFLKQISGVSDSKRGFDRADVAAKAIRAKQQAGNVNLAKPMNNLIRTRHLLVKTCLPLIQEYYSEQRMFQITSPGVGKQPEQLIINQQMANGEVANDLTVGEYDIVITDVPSRDNYEDSQFDEAMRMREAGIAVPDHVLISHSHLQNKEEIVEQMRDAAGTDDPNETERQLAALEVQIKQLEAEEKRAKIMTDQANAALALARAESTRSEAEGGMSEKEAAEIAAQRERQQEELRLEREKIQAELRMKREQFEEEMKLKRAQMRQDALMEQAKMRYDMQQKKAAGGNSNDSE